MSVIKHKTILFIGNEISDTIAEIDKFKNEGYTVISSQDVEKAIEFLNENETINLIVVDLDIEKKSDSNSLVIELLKDKNIPVLFLLSSAEKGIIDRIEKTSSYGYMLKKTDFSVLNASVKMAFKLSDVMTERKKAEESHRETKTYLENLFNYANAPIIVWDRNFRITKFNKAFERISGQNESDVLGKEVDILFPRTTREQSIEYIKKASSGDRWEVVEIEILHINGSVRTLLWNSAAIYDSEGMMVIATIAQGQDITDRKLAEEALKKAQEKQINKQNVFLKTLINTIPNPVFVKNSKFKYVEINKAFETFFEISREEILGKTNEMIYPKEVVPVLTAIDKKLIRKAGNKTYESYYINKRNEKIYILVYKASLVNESDKPYGIVGLAIDISAQKEMEQKILAAYVKEKELNEMKTSFISMASHEFRSPLTTILGSVGLLEMFHSTWPPEKTANLLLKIQNSVAEMTDLLEDVLSYSRYERGKIQLEMVETNINEFLIETVNLIKLKPEQKIILKNESLPSSIIIDPKIISHILINLLNNASKYSKEGSQIYLDIKFIKKSNLLIIKVIDNGIGIDNSDFKNLFDPFFRGKNVLNINGSGLGLCIVKRLTEIHHGSIDVVSKLKEGSVFTITLTTGK